MTEEEVLEEIVRHEERQEALPHTFVVDHDCAGLLRDRGWEPDPQTRWWTPPL